MLRVRGRSTGGRQDSAIRIEERVDAALVEIAVQIGIDHHCRRMVAMPETHDRQEREASVGRGPALPYAEAPLEVLAQPLVPHDPAGDAVAEQDDVSSDRTSEDEIVEGRDAVQ